VPELVLNAGTPNEEVFPLQDLTTFIGRAKDNKIVILDASLSRRHAKIEINGEHFRVSDLQSRNGTSSPFSFIDAAPRTSLSFRQPSFAAFRKLFMNSAPPGMPPAF
jgi:hypothetical protein